jgi:signal transduction histidine kinase/CheY-like chemotaxis protein
MPGSPDIHGAWAPDQNPDTWLGELREPPAALQTAVDLCHASPLPMMVWWQAHPEPFINGACRAIANTDHHSAPDQLWQALATDVELVMRSGQAVLREGAALMLPHADSHKAEQGAFCLHPLKDQGRTAGVLIIGTQSDPRPSSAWREHMNYAAVIHSMDLGFGLVELLEPDGSGLHDYRYLEVNPAYEAHSGLSDLVGRRISESMSVREPFWPRAFNQVLASGQMLQATVTLTSVARTLETCIMRVGGPGSRQLVVLVKDATEQQRVARALQNSEQQARDAAVRAKAEHNRLAAVLEATPAAVIVVNACHEITLVNSQARQVWGNLPQAGSMAWRGRWADGSARHGRRLSPSQWPLSRALRGEIARDLIEIISPKDSRERGIFLTSAAPIWDDGPAIDGAVVVAVDITDRVMAERALRVSNERKDEFLAMLAHELRNPLAPIAVAAEMMRRPDTSAQAMRESSTIIGRQVRHMRGLIDDLLDAARVKRGSIGLDQHCVDLRPLVSDAIEQAAALLQTMGHELQVNLPEQPLPVHGDTKRIVQILVNLLNNAAKYTPAAGRVAIEAWAQDGWAVAEVSDNGVGMDQDTLARAFDLFAQADQSADRQQGGLGIGLALVKKLVELHGGRVSASSDGPGCGSRLTVRLPLCSTEELKQPAKADASPVFAPSRLRILVVDDNVDAAKTLAMFLKTCDHYCSVALTLAGQTRPEVFSLDIGLPGMDGTQLARRLRADPATASATLLALSGYAQAHDKQAALTAGFDHYLVKPVDVDQLLRLLQTVRRQG